MFRLPTSFICVRRLPKPPLLVLVGNSVNGAENALVEAANRRGELTTQVVVQQQHLRPPPPPPLPPLPRRCTARLLSLPPPLPLPLQLLLRW